MADLTKKQWEVLKPHFAAYQQPETPKRGRPWREPRDVLNGILWILRTGAQWADMPSRYPPYQTCHRRFQAWTEDGTLDLVLETLARDLEERGQFELSEGFIDGSFVPAKKGGAKLAKQSEEKGPRSWQSQTALVFLSPSGSKVLRRMRSRS